VYATGGPIWSCLFISFSDTTVTAAYNTTAAYTLLLLRILVQ
jgi:hypothetical protein